MTAPDNTSMKDIMTALTAYIEKLERENRELKQREQERKDRREEQGELADLPDVLTVEEVAKYLRMTKAQVYTLMKTGSLPNFPGGSHSRTYRVMKNDLADWIVQQKETASGQDDSPVHIMKYGRRRMA